MRALRRIVAPWAASIVLLAASSSSAQVAGSSETLPLERWRTPTDDTGLGTTAGGGMPDHLEVQAGYVANMSINPLIIISPGSDGALNRAANPVQFRLHGDVVASFGLFDYFALGVNVPHVLYQAPLLPDPSSNTSITLDDHFSFIGVGDLKLVPKVRLLREDKHFVSLSIIPAVTLPTAAGLGLSEQIVDYGGSYLGEGPLLFSFRPEVALSSNFYGVRLAGNLAWHLRPSRRFLGFVPMGSEIVGRGGVGYDLAWLWEKLELTEKTNFPLESLVLYGEVFTHTADRDPYGVVTFASGQLGRDPSRPADDPLNLDEQIALARTRIQTHMEASVGARWTIAYGFQAEGGIAVPVLSGYGTPDFRAYGGLRWKLERNDKDGDGIDDSKDACPTEPEDKDGINDSDGCPDPDNDGDGLIDVVDRCRDEPEDKDGYLDDDGCPDPDNDDDQIPDDEDRCPDEAGPAETGGCPIIDADKDGLPDEIDRCPDQMGPLERDGCPIIDTDEDGLMDEEDLCPTEKGPIDRKGCPLKDRDSDGVEDGDDKCPDDPGPVERQGCPITDGDLDGVLDKDDKCPKKPGPRSNGGCPIPDTDGDSVVDDVDECKDVPGPVIFKGCPDTDGDGVEDRQDKCPEEAGLKMFDGCNDRDNDGVPDFADKCPDEPEVINGIDDLDGCPDQGKRIVIVTKKAIEIRDRVFFNFGKSTIQERSFDLLNQVGQVLKANPQITKVEVQGHTDSRGDADYNRRLSQRRAEAVVGYLVERGGLDATRLVAKGYGEDQPLTDNDTEDGRARNRRVEFVIVEQDAPAPAPGPTEQAPVAPEATEPDATEPPAAAPPG